MPNLSPLPSAPNWRGLHLLIRCPEEMEALIAEAPALAQAGINTLLVEINYFYEYRSHPEVREPEAVSHAQVKRLVQTARAHNLRLIPQLMCLGHQSWEARTFGLLRAHPEFDETPGQFPQNQGIYCRSWCPQHPQVHALVFDLLDELLEAFEADALHVGMDEVFLIASEHCPRCKGGDPAGLLAHAINDFHAHLVQKRGVEMLMWGDRLLDDQVMGYGAWEASQNNTHAALQHIPKDIIIADWHYEPGSSYPSVQFFQQHGFRVLPCGWRDEQAAIALIEASRRGASERMLGYMATTWGAVAVEEMASWPPLLAALVHLGAG